MYFPKKLQQKSGLTPFESSRLRKQKYLKKSGFRLIYIIVKEGIAATDLQLIIIVDAPGGM